MPRWTLLALVFAMFPLTASAADRPNFIFYITDDISANDYGCYGHPTIKTPHLDRMANEGRIFDRAYLTTSSCSPTRCSIITGRYPHNTGAPELHTNLPGDQTVFPELLKAAGYHTALSGKHHMGKKVNRGFDVVNGGKGPGRQENWVALLRDRPKDKPFFFWFASIDAHRDWQINDDAPKYDPKDVVVPPYLPDTPLVRKDFADYYHEVSRADHYLGELRKELERQGIADNTYIIFCSDNGRPMPRAKSWLVEEGIRTPLVVWKGGKIKPARTDAFVSVIDISATVLDLAGVDKAETIQGISFAKILDDPKSTTRDIVFAEHNWHVYQAHERMVRHGQYLYIRNSWPDLWTMGGETGPWFPSGKELFKAVASGKATALQKSVIATPRPVEQLYHVEADPLNVTNLVDLPEHEQALNRMRKLLDQWTEQTGDTVPDNPTNDREAVDRSRKNPNHKRGEFPGQSRNATKINHPGPIRVKTGA